MADRIASYAWTDAEVALLLRRTGDSAADERALLGDPATTPVPA